jgi:hypothetical protein
MTFAKKAKLSLGIKERLLRSILFNKIIRYFRMKRKYKTVKEAIENNSLSELKWLVRYCNAGDGIRANGGFYLDYIASIGYLEILKYLIKKCGVNNPASKNRIIRRFHKLLINYLFFIYY